MNQKKAKEILAQVTQTYSLIADEFSASRKEMTRDLTALLPFMEPSGLIADIGCGNGRLAVFLQKNLPQSQPHWNYVGIDQNPRFIELAQNLQTSAQTPPNPGVRFIQGNMLSLPLKNHEASTIIALRSLHHIPSKALRQKALAEMFRTLKPEGVLIISVWNLWLPQRAWALVKAWVRSILTLCAYSPKDTFIPWGKNVQRYYYAFTLGELKKLVTQAGFTVTATPRIPDVNDFIIIAKK